MMKRKNPHSSFQKTNVSGGYGDALRHKERIGMRMRYLLLSVIILYGAFLIGTIRTAVVVMADTSAISLSAAKVKLSDTILYYDGSAQKPTVTVTCDGAVLTKDTDYTVKYANNTNVGLATVTVTGKGDYTGTVTKRFKIKKCDLSGASITVTYDSDLGADDYFDGFVFTVVLNGTTLTEDSDYWITSQSGGCSTSFGSGTNYYGSVTIEGEGNYRGSCSTDFDFTLYDLSDYSDCISLSYSTATYSGKARKPSVTIKIGGMTLTKGTDYTVSYKNNTDTGKATVTIKGKGDFTGTVKKYFYIVPKKASISSAKSSASGKITVKYKKCTGADGYQIAYKRTNSDTWSYVKTTSLSKTIKSLTSGKSYNVKVRAYIRTSSGKYKYGKWSSAKKVKVK